MSVTTCEQITVAVVPEKYPDAKTTFKITKDVKLREMTKEDILVSTQYVSVDPYLRGRLPTWVNKPIASHCVAQVLEVGADVTKFKKGDYLSGVMPWQSHSVLKAAAYHGIPSQLPKWKAKDAGKKDEDGKEEKAEMMDISAIPKSYYVGQYGMPGMTAYYGLFEKGSCKASDTVLVSGGAGAVGAMVGQFARMQGCKKIIGTAGSQAKMDFMKSIGFTDVINYKEVKDTASMQKKLKEILGKDGSIDLYFDNTGGHVTHAQWDLLNQGARVIICGQISNYNSGNEIPKEEHFLRKLIYREIDVRGIMVANMKNHAEFYARVGEWIVNKDVTIRETVVKGGMDCVPQAFCDLFVGKNIGKMVVDLTGKK